MEKPGLIKKFCKGMLASNILLLCFSECHEPAEKKTPMPEKKSVKGILHDQQGKPVADAVIMVTDSSHSLPDIASNSDEKGEFYLDNLILPGSYTILINHHGISARKTIRLDETDSVFTVQL
jgi:hypothetical protein